MKITLLIFACLFTLQSYAQGIQIREHDGVQQLMSQYKNYHKETSTIKGYRIQIVTTDDRFKMEKALSKFRNLYPEMNSDWEHKIPYYLVKVGAFKEKLDYQGFLIEIKKDFPGAIPIVADIREEELLTD